VKDDASDKNQNQIFLEIENFHNLAACIFALERIRATKIICFLIYVSSVYIYVYMHSKQSSDKCCMIESESLTECQIFESEYTLQHTATQTHCNTLY